MEEEEYGISVAGVVMVYKRDGAQLCIPRHTRAAPRGPAKFCQDTGCVYVRAYISTSVIWQCTSIPRRVSPKFKVNPSYFRHRRSGFCRTCLSDSHPATVRDCFFHLTSQKGPPCSSSHLRVLHRSLSTPVVSFDRSRVPVETL